MSSRIRPLATVLAVCVVIIEPAPPGVPPGYSVAIEARGLDRASDLRLGPAGQLIADSADPGSGYEIRPATPQEPAAVMQVAVELTAPTPHTNFTAAVDASALRWNASLAQLTLRTSPGKDIDLAYGRSLPGDLVVRWSEDSPGRSAVSTDDGNVYILESRAGLIYRLTPRPTAL